MRLPKYDKGSQIFSPHYFLAVTRVIERDLVAILCGDEIKIGMVTNVRGNVIQVQVIPREFEDRATSYINIHRKRVVAIFFNNKEYGPKE